MGVITRRQNKNLKRVMTHQSKLMFIYLIMLDAFLFLIASVQLILVSAVSH